MLQKHQLNLAAWRPTLVLTQQTNYIIDVHTGNHTPWASSLLLFFPVCKPQIMGQNHESTCWKHFVQVTACTPHYVCFHGTLLSQEQGVSHGWWFITCLLLFSFCRSPMVPPSSPTQTTSASITLRRPTLHRGQATQLTIALEKD